MTEDEMVGWQLDGHEFERAPRVGDGQGSLVGYSLGHKQSDTTEETEHVCTYTVLRCRQHRRHTWSSDTDSIEDTHGPQIWTA